MRGEQQTVLNTKLYKGQLLAIHFLNHILEQPNGASFHHFQKQSTDTHFQLNQTLSLNKSSILKESYILNISVFFCQIYVNSKLRNHFNLWRCKRLPQFSTNFDQLLSHKFWLFYGLSNARFHKLARNTMVQSMYWKNHIWKSISVKKYINYWKYQKKISLFCWAIGEIHI